MMHSLAVLAGLTMPFPYRGFDRFPGAWFGSNGTDWESAEQLEEIGRYSMAILGWQHMTTADSWNAVVYAQLTQAAAIKDAHPDLPVFVYCSFGWAFGMNAAVWPLMSDPAYSDYFLQASDGPEYSQTNCQQMGSSDKHCIGWFWKFSNASARNYFVQHLVQPLADAPMIDGVFFDAFNYAYDIPEVRPWGRVVVNVPDCGVNDTWTGCDVLIEGALDVAARTATLLNAHGKVPMFANPASFYRPAGRQIWLDEERLLAALQGTQWMLYYESARAEESVADPTNGAAQVRSLAAVHGLFVTCDRPPRPFRHLRPPLHALR